MSRTRTPNLTNVRSSDKSHHLVSPVIFALQVLHLPAQLVPTRLFYLATTCTFLLPKRHTSSAHHGAGNPPSVRSFWGSILFLSAKATDLLLDEQDVVRSLIRPGCVATSKAPYRALRAMGLLGKRTLERCTRRCRKRSTC